MTTDPPPTGANPGDIDFVGARATTPNSNGASSGLAAIAPPGGGQQLQRRWGYPVSLVIDPLTVGAENLSVGTEVLSPGHKIPHHRHPNMEEIVVVLSGTILAEIGDQQLAGGPGTIAFAPKNTEMGFTNMGDTDATIMWVFDRPGFENYVRATSVGPDESPMPMSVEEMLAIRERFKDVVVFPEEFGHGSEGYPTT